jgi:UDP-3-O-[3-hydroxymyristoyl] N-acetylglucosamine deacetylase
MHRQTTVARTAGCAGVGVHSGAPARLTLKASPAGAGVVFVRTDIEDRDNRIPAHALNVTTTQLGTNIANAAGASVATVEHFLAACCALKLDNVIAELDGPELPILDGSSAPFLKLIEEAGIAELDAPRRRIEVLKTVEVREGAKFARLSPGEGFTVSATIDFPSRAIGRQGIELRLDAGSFAREIAWARTFGFAHEIDALKAKGLARGGSLDNAIVVDGDAILNPGGAREREFVRHKVIDVAGDLFLAGAPIEGRYEAEQPGHALNNKLVRALLADPEAHRFAPG